MSDWRPPPAYSDDPNDPFRSTPPPDPNLSYTTPPNPANMRLPPGADSSGGWHVLSRARAVGISSSWLLANSLLHGVPGQTHVSVNTWEEALAQYTEAYNARAVSIYAPGTAAGSARGSARPHTSASRTPQATPGASRGNPHFVASNASTPARLGHAQHPILVGSSPISNASTPARVGHAQRPIPVGSSPVSPSRSEARFRTIQRAVAELQAPSTPAEPGSAHHPISIGSSPAPPLSNNSEVRHSPHSGIAPGTPARQDGADLEANVPGSRLQESESSLQTPPAPRALDRFVNNIRARIRHLELVLSEYEARNHSSRNPSSATSAAGRSNIEARLSALEASMNIVLTREAQRDSLDAMTRGVWQLSPRDSHSCNNRALDGRDPPSSSAFASLDGRDSATNHSSSSVAGSSTGPGTIAGTSSAGSSTGPGTAASSTLSYPVVVIDDDDDEYEFDAFTPEEQRELDELLNAIHANYNANKK